MSFVENAFFLSNKVHQKVSHLYSATNTHISFSLYIAINSRYGQLSSELAKRTVYHVCVRVFCFVCLADTQAQSVNKHTDHNVPGICRANRTLCQFCGLNGVYWRRISIAPTGYTIGSVSVGPAFTSSLALLRTYANCKRSTHPKHHGQYRCISLYVRSFFRH